MEYVDKFIRGIPKESHIDSEGFVSADIFQFQKKSREDQNEEASINWYDDDGAVENIHNKLSTREGSMYQFEGGAAILNRLWLDDELKKPNIPAGLSYERHPIEGENPYHGNLLLQADVPKPKRRIILTILASCIQDVKKRNEKG